MKNNRNGGFSLIELLIAMAIFSMVLASVYGVYISSSRINTVQNVAVGVQQSVRVGLDIMAQDIRMAGYDDPSASSNAKIEVAEKNKIRVTSDRDGDGTNSGILEDITYELSNSQLKKNTQPMLNHVTKLQFTYWDEDGNDLGASPVIDDIRSVTISLAVEEPAGLGNSVSRQLQTRVFCRNLAN